jgi:chromosome segregation ATPase
MINITPDYTFLFVNVCFIIYIFFLKYKNKICFKRNSKLKETIQLYHKDQTKIINEIHDLSNDLSKKTNNQMEIQKKYNNMIYEFELYKKIVYNLEKDNEKLIKSDKKYKTLFEECKENNFTLEKDYKNLNHDMDKLADSYKDLYKSRDDITNENKNLKEKINDLEQDICEVEADIFMYKNTRFDFEKKIQIANQIEEEQKIEILKLRNLLKNEKKKLKKSKSFFKRNKKST